MIRPRSEVTTPWSTYLFSLFPVSSVNQLNPNDLFLQIKYIWWNNNTSCINSTLLPQKNSLTFCTFFKCFITICYENNQKLRLGRSIGKGYLFTVTKGCGTLTESSIVYTSEGWQLANTVTLWRKLTVYISNAFVIGGLYINVSGDKKFQTWRNLEAWFHFSQLW